MRGLGQAAVGAALVVMLATPSAQRRGGGGDANAPMPVATNTILRRPDAYVGKQVAVSAGVEAVLSKTVFLIDQRKATGPAAVTGVGAPLLVIAPYLTVALEPSAYLSVSGQVVAFDPSTIGRLVSDYTLDLSPEVSTRYRGQPVLLATSVVSSTFIEMARKPIPPPSANEVSFVAAMKAIGPAFTALRTAAQATQSDTVARQVATLRPAFTQTERIWYDLGQSPAAAWAGEANDYAGEIERAAATGNWEKVQASAGALNQVCQSCHGVYRERQPDGTFRIKPGSF